MHSAQRIGAIYCHIAEVTGGNTLSVLGPTVEFVSWADEPHGDLCVMRGVVPPGVTVPLHKHDDAEDFLILAGDQQVLTEGHQGGLHWADAHAGDYVSVPGGTWHAHRNVSGQPAVDLIITTARLGRFFREVGRPVTGSPEPPAPGDVAQFIAVATRYGHTLGTPEQNAAVGIEMPEFAAG
jgi:quercetin dioxygenase-like cupin family protein